jgi:hypothetical protein
MCYQIYGYAYLIYGYALLYAYSIQEMRYYLYGYALLLYALLYVFNTRIIIYVISAFQSFMPTRISDAATSYTRIWDSLRLFRFISITNYEIVVVVYS